MIRIGSVRATGDEKTIFLRKGRLNRRKQIAQTLIALSSL